MKRARQKQAGCVVRKGDFWYVRYREPVVLEDGTVRQVHKSRKLTKATGPYQTKRAAEGIWPKRRYEPLSDDGVLVPESTMTLNRFIETVYLRLRGTSETSVHIHRISQHVGNVT